MGQVAGGRAGLPRSGDVLHINREASVQFTTPIHFRVIRVLDWPTYVGWIWLDGYQLNASGDAVDRRSIFVQTRGLRAVSGGGSPPAPRRPTQHRATTRSSGQLCREP